MSVSGEPTTQMSPLAFHAALFLPSFVMTAFGQSSMAVGLTLYMVALCLYFAGHSSFLFLQVYRSVVIGGLTLILCILLFVLVHAAIPFLNSSLFDVERFFSSYFVLFIMTMATWVFGYNVTRADTVTVSRLVGQALWFLLINALLGLTELRLFPQMSSKPVGLFSEPSHLALVLAPLLVYACAIELRWHRLFIVFFFVWSLLIQNLTTLSVVILCFTVMFRFNAPRVLLLILLGGGLVLSELEYFTSRLLITSESENLSVLVLLQGWEIAKEMLDGTSYWGAGFQQFGFLNIFSNISSKIALLSEEDLNLLDGGSTASKLVGEFGIFAIAGLGIYVVFFFWAFRQLRQSRAHQISGGRLFLISCLFAFIIELFIRGVGYFSPTCFLALSAVMGFANAPRPYAPHI